jgi:hypothetical protein
MEDTNTNGIFLSNKMPNVVLPGRWMDPYPSTCRVKKKPKGEKDERRRNYNGRILPASI